MLLKAVGGGRESDFHEKIVTKMYDSMLLTLRRAGGCRISRTSVT